VATRCCGGGRAPHGGRRDRSRGGRRRRPVGAVERDGPEPHRPGRDRRCRRRPAGVGDARERGRPGRRAAVRGVGERLEPVDATNDTLSAPLVPGATYGVLEVADAGPTCPDAGAAAGSRDLDDDGRCEDLDGDGRFGFLDVVTLLFADWAAINDDPSTRPLFDFDGSGKVDFLDVVTLLFEL
jgi:hypothetical protein